MSIGHPEQSPDREPRFSSARDLFEAVRAAEPAERRRALGWVAGHPAESIALGAEDGRDIVDVLISLVPEGLDYPYWEDVAIAIGSFDAPRVTGFFVEVLAGATSAEQAYDASAQLGRRQRGGLRERLVEILLSDGPPERLAATAELLVGEDELPPAAAVRVAALEQGREPPTLTDAVADAWVDELSGHFGPQARERLEQVGAEATRALSARWERLDPDDRAWLLDWAAEVSPGAAPELIARAVESGPEELTRVALEACARLPAEASIGALRPLVRSPRPETRAAAVRALLVLRDDAWLSAELLDRGPWPGPGPHP
jgi:hypothetical protein